MAVRRWSAKESARHFVLHENSVRSWIKALGDERRAERLLGQPPWNKTHDGVRWLVREIRMLCPEREFGTRSIVRHIIRAGIQISETSVRRILEEEVLEPKRATPSQHKVSSAPQHIQHPTAPRRVWHLDLTGFGVLWWRFEIAAIRGCSIQKSKSRRCTATRHDPLKAWKPGYKVLVHYSPL